jgi:hypothetical protein
VGQVSEMSTTTVGLLTGLALGFAGYFGGFGAFVVVAALGAVGLVVGYLARSGVRPGEFVRGRDDRGPRETFAPRQRDHGPQPHAEHGSRVR